MGVILLVGADQPSPKEKRGGAVGAMRQPARSDRPVRADPGLGQDGWALADNDKGSGVVRLKTKFPLGLGLAAEAGARATGLLRVSHRVAYNRLTTESCQF